MGVDAQRPSDAFLPDLALMDEYSLGQPGDLLDILPLGICICDRNGAIVRYNHSAIALWGRTPRLGELADVFWATLGVSTYLHGPAENTPRLVNDALAGGAPVHDREMLIAREDNSRVVVRVTAQALLDNMGVCIGAVTCWQDITEIRLVPSVPREAERHSHDLLNTLPVAVYTTDAEGRINFFNQSAVALWGRTPTPGEDKWCGTHALRWPDGRPMHHDECPMAVALRERRAIRGGEAIAERPDGSLIHFLAYPTPIWDETGAMIGAINTLVDITERKLNEDSMQHLASIIESSNDAIVSKNLNSIIKSWNQAAVRLFGYTANEAIGKPVTILIPADRQNEEEEILRRIRRGERVEHYDTIRQRKDGSLIEVSIAVSPVKNAIGTVVGASKIARDISERKRAAEKQILLLREMNHRVKNLFALAGSIVTLSARFARTPKELADAVRARLTALSQAHDLTLPNLADEAARSEKQTTLRALIQTIVSPHNDTLREGDERVTINGPDVRIGGSAMTSFALLLHEFMTNAAKYGALSEPTGHVDVTWMLSDDKVHLVWRERGGPPIGNQTQVEGFGSLLARATVKGQLGGSIARDWEASGLTVHLTVPLERLTA